MPDGDARNIQLGSEYAKNLVMVGVDKSSVVQSSSAGKVKADAIDFYSFPRILQQVEREKQAAQTALAAREVHLTAVTDGILNTLDVQLRRAVPGVVTDPQFTAIMDGAATIVTNGDEAAYNGFAATAKLREIRRILNEAGTEFEQILADFHDDQNNPPETMRQLQDVIQRKRPRITQLLNELAESPFSACFAPEVGKINIAFDNWSTAAASAMYNLAGNTDPAAVATTITEVRDFCRKPPLDIGEVATITGDWARRQQEELDSFNAAYRQELEREKAQIIAAASNYTADPTVINAKRDLLRSILKRCRDNTFKKIREGEQTKWQAVYNELGEQRKRKHEEFQTSATKQDEAMRRHYKYYEQPVTIGVNAAPPPPDVDLNKEKVEYNHGITAYNYGESKVFTIDDISMFGDDRAKQIKALTEIMRDIYGVNPTDNVYVGSARTKIQDFTKKDAVIHGSFMAAGGASVPAILQMASVGGKIAAGAAAGMVKAGAVVGAGTGLGLGTAGAGGLVFMGAAAVVSLASHAITAGVDKIRDVVAERNATEVQAALAVNGVMKTDGIKPEKLAEAKEKYLVEVKSVVQQLGGNVDDISLDISKIRRP